MSPLRDQLQSTLAQLHAELEQLEDVDPQVRSLLEGAVGDIRTTLDQSSEDTTPTADNESIIARFRQAAEHFDDEHPTIAGILGSAIDTLSRMGI